MARTLFDIPFAQDPRAVDSLVRGILTADGYHEIDYNNEVVWKKGTGAMTAMHCIKLEYYANVLRVSGWVQVGLGSVGGKERDLTGFTCAVPKQSVKKAIEKVQIALAQMAPSSSGNPNIPR